MMPTWIPLMDYAMKSGVSLSTLRRYIKANKIPFRIENGRYLLLLEDGATANTTPTAKPVQPNPLSAPNAATMTASTRDEVRKLEQDLQRAREEIVELKTLIALYEENMPAQRFSN